MQTKKIMSAIHEVLKVMLLHQSIMLKKRSSNNGITYKSNAIYEDMRVGISVLFAEQQKI